METKLDLDIGISQILKDLDFSKYDLLDNSLGHFKLTRSDLVDEFAIWIESQGLEIKLAELFCCPPNADIFVHSDCVEHGQVCCKLNWVYCNSLVPMDWYYIKPNAELTKKYNTIGGYYLTAEPGEYCLYSSKLIGQPSMVNVSDLHGVKNTSADYWWCVSIVLKKKESDQHRIHWNDLYEKVKPWIKTE